MMTPPTIRAARADEAEHLTALAMRSKAHWGYDQAFLQQCRAELTVQPNWCDEGLVFVAERNGETVGYYYADMNWAKTEVEHLFVEAGAMGQGIGGSLVQHLISRSEVAGAAQIVVESDPQAEPFYRSMDFGPFGDAESKSIKGRTLPRFVRFHRGRRLGGVKDATVTVDPSPWGYAAEYADDIKAHWRAVMERQPSVFDGQVFITRSWDLNQGTLQAKVSLTQYSAFLAWRDLGYPDRTANNLFGSAAIISRDGAILYGEMAGWTSNAGLIYPPGGSLDPSDIANDGSVDVHASIVRELHEETGLKAENAMIGPLMITDDGPRLSAARFFRFSVDAEPLRDEILAHNARSKQPELSDVVILRDATDIDPSRMPGYAQAIAHAHFEGDGL